MGFERLAMIVQQAGSTYETDLLRPTVDRILELAGLPAIPMDERRVAVRIIADHARALAFAIAAGIVPGNEGRAYVIRRLLRRAARRGRELGMKGPFLNQVAQVVIATYADAYPELTTMEEAIHGVTRAEEERFARTLDAGMDRFAAILAERRKGGERALTGGDLFQLYDTYGFPADLTEEMAREAGLQVDRAGFDTAMAEQRERARKAHKFQSASASGGAPWTVLSEGPDSEFLGYETVVLEAAVRRFRAGGDGLVDLVLDATPFYAEAGGQVGDQGALESVEFAIDVLDTVGEPRPDDAGGGRVHVHRGRFRRGTVADLAALGPEGRVMARVDAERRAAIMRNHTATHLLHAALRAIVGTHVQQSGSLVAPDRLRFDFTHFAALTPEQIAAIELEVNLEILRNAAVEVREESYSEATGRGAIALFGEKYGREVRTIGVAGFSLELCGGTHCRGTGDIGLFKIVSESAIGAGMRRIEAVTGLGSLALVREQDRRLLELAGLLGVGGTQIADRVRSLVRENGELKQRLRANAGGGVEKQVEEVLANAENSGGHRLVAAQIEVDSVDLLRQAGDLLRQRLRSGAGVLAAVMGGKVSFLAVVTDDLIGETSLRADELVREVAAVAGGSGGGKAHQAMGSGGKQVELIGPALDRGRAFLRERVKAAARS
jgi:alanyl-tRNA synthetase